MKKTIEVFSIVTMVIGCLATIGATVYIFMYLGLLSEQIILAMNNEANKVGFIIGLMIGFIALAIYSCFVALTALLTRKVITKNVLDKIGKFGVLSIIFFNPVGGILTLIYNDKIKKELERTAPKGKRKEIQE